MPSLQSILSCEVCRTRRERLLRRRPLPNGRRFKRFLAGYLLFRLLVEFLKPTAALPGLGLTAIQWACVAGLGYYGWLWLRGGTRGASAALEVH